MINYNNYYSK